MRKIESCRNCIENFYVFRFSIFFCCLLCKAQFVHTMSDSKEESTLSTVTSGEIIVALGSENPAKCRAAELALVWRHFAFFLVLCRI